MTATASTPLSSRQPVPFAVKGWCPGALKPMRTGDGLVVRLRLTAGILPAALAHEIADLSERYGNGRMDLTQRANLQLRGVSDGAWPDLIDRLSALGILDPDAEIEAARNVVVSPLDDDGRASVDAVAAARQLEAAIGEVRDFRNLSGKFGFVIDDGGALSLDDVASDVRFVGVDGRFAVEIGDFWRLGLIEAEDVGAVAIRIVQTFLRLRNHEVPLPGRIRSLIDRIGASAIAVASGFDPVEVAVRAPRPLGDFLGWQTGFTGVSVVFGRISSMQLRQLADQAERVGRGDLRLTPWRAILIPHGSMAVPEFDLGPEFITSCADPRLAVAACPGAPECESGIAPVRSDALAWAELAARLPGEGVRLHVSGCQKGCARPQATAVTLIARDDGYALVRSGRASDNPISTGLSRQAIESILRTNRAETQLSDRSSYIRDGAEIYRHSFAIIRAEADLARFSAAEEPVAVRIIHACGMVEIAPDILFSEGAAAAGRAALRDGAPIFADAEMVARGVTRARLPANNDVICTLTDPRVLNMAARAGTTRSAAAMELWRDRLGGAIVAIGNAPTALFRLLEMLDEGAPLPACVIGMPVGFVGAAESKDALMLDGRVPSIVVRGRRGGSAMAAATVNALASDRE